MADLNKNIKIIPILGYLGFFVLYIVLGVLMVLNFLPVPDHGLPDPPIYEALNFFDILILLSFNIPTFILIGIAISKIYSKKSDKNSDIAKG